jgi:hypothetical protein
MSDGSTLQLLGAGGFGLLLGWYVYYINRHRREEVKLGDLVTLIGVGEPEAADAAVFDIHYDGAPKLSVAVSTDPMFTGCTAHEQHLRALAPASATPTRATRRSRSCAAPIPETSSTSTATEG